MSQQRPLKFAPALERVLHVDDDPDIQEITRYALESIAGLQVESCLSGEEAIARAPLFRPHLLLLDVMLPKVDGMDLYRALTEIADLQDLPLMFMTSATDTVDLSRYREFGAIGTIMKPIDYRSLGDTVRDLWSAAKSKHEAELSAAS